MTIEAAIEGLRSMTANGWSKSKSIPDDLIAALCDAIWDAGQHPRIKTIRQYLPNVHELSITKGFHAWRRAKGLHVHYPRWANPNIGGAAVLARVVSPEIAAAPLTFFDKHNDGRWHAPHPRVVAYLASGENQSLRDVLALYALIKSDLGEFPLYARLANYVVPMTKLMAEERLDSIYEIDPHDLLLRVCERKAGFSLTDRQRPLMVISWNLLTNAFQEYGERLNDVDRESMSKFFLKPLRKRHRMHWSRPSIVLRDSSRERVKAKTDVVHAQFHKLRFMARIRCSQARRLYEAVSTAIVTVAEGNLPLPYAFGYEETVATEAGKPIHQRVLLTLWDTASLWNHSIEKGHKASYKLDLYRRKQAGRFASDRKQFFVQYRGTEGIGSMSVTHPFWFLELYDHQIFSGRRTKGSRNN
jgi:hypothetical protein